MIGKGKVKYYCQECGYESLRWLGRCPECQKWNSFVEEVTEKKKTSLMPLSITNPPVKISAISLSEQNRFDTGIPEFNRVLGGGLVPGALVLLAGDPGIGKSTLTLQLANSIKLSKTILYITGEESAQQIKMRAERLNVNRDNFYVLAETDLSTIEYYLNEIKPQLLIIDSIQTVYLPEITSAPGSVSQLRECTNKVMKWAKVLGISTILVGHVTKEGAVAGPRVLEHMVDCVLYFEGERHYQYRVLRGLKNRYGSTNELGIFEMTGNGLEEVKNPSQAFLAERPIQGAGSAVVACMEGSRPLLIELQALVSPTLFGQPRRMTTGTDYNRVAMLMAVLDKRLGLHLGNYDVFVNIVGGLKINEPAIDLGIASAVVSSFQNKPINKDTVVIGEMGLTGEVRSVSHLEKRLSEAYKLGFTKAVIPYSNYKLREKYSIEMEKVRTVGEALEIILEG